MCNSIKAQCFSDRHSTLLEDYWISCTLEASPNPERPESHWIMYDFGETHRLGSSHFWNINRPGFTNMGSHELLVDYSTDGINWLEWGQFELEEAQGDSYYQGEAGPDFGGIEARYVLITITESYGQNCAGLAEVRIESMGIISSTEDLAEDSRIQINLQPNPAYDETYVEFESDGNEDAWLSVIDATGRPLYRTLIRTTKGINTAAIQLEGIPAGQYTVRLESKSGERNAQLAIVK